MAKLIKWVFVRMVAIGVGSLWVLCSALITMLFGLDDLWPVIAKTGAAMVVVTLCMLVTLGVCVLLIEDL